MAQLKIFALLSIDNNYDQPSNNLVIFWKQKPTLEQVAKAVGWEFPATKDEHTLTIVKIWQGESQRVCETDYRIEELTAGKKL